MRRLLYYTRELHHYIYLTSWFPSAGAVPSPLSRPPPLRSSQSSAPEQQEEEEATDRDREGEEGDKSFWTWLQRLILLFCPEGDDARRPSQSSGGAAGGLALVGIVTLLIVLYLRHRRRTSDSSESNSSGRALPDMQSARCMTLEELQSATNNFSSSNLVGHGMFGEVYNGLLQDGTVIAVKRRHSPPSQEFLHEVNYLSSIHHHRNLVNLLGYCQDNGMQMLVYQYVPNGSISTHLHGNGHSPTVRLEFKQRLAIAHGAAKGLSHLHSMTPPAVHMNFKTANVLVDADFVPKVADTGIRGLLDRLGNAGPPSMIFNDPFVDPRGKESMIFSIQSDVYSFGVFLVELISGRTAVSDQGIIEWVRNFQESSDISAIADRRMTSVFTSLGMKELLRLASRCVNPASENRPSMSLVEAEIHRIHEQEIGMTTIMPRGNTTVALGSQLFTSPR